jgi:hypothetical protein
MKPREAARPIGTDYVGGRPSIMRRNNTPTIYL